MTNISSSADQIKPQYTVVVIGSGYGGGIAASRLARAGQSVCVLERGKEIRPGDYPHTEPKLLEQVQVDTPLGHEGSSTALFDFRINDQMNALVGCGLGGTSLINANVGLEPTPVVFEDERWPEELRRAGVLDAGYQHAREMLGANPYPADMPPLAKLEALRLSAQAIPGAEFAKAPIYVTFQDPPGGVNKFGVHQQQCTLCGNCITGCNYSAKNTVLMNYLPDAKNHGAEIFTEVSVKRIERAGDRWVVHYYITGSREHQLQGAAKTITADLVVLAAGTLGSTEILLRSKQTGLPASNMVGQRFSSNGDLLGFAYNGSVTINGIGGQPPPDPVPGPCIAGFIDMRSRTSVEGMLFEEAAIPGGITFGLPEAFAAIAHLEGKDTDPAESKDQLLRALESVVRGVYHGATKNTQTLLGMGYDAGTGVLDLQHDRLRISWPNVGVDPTFRAESDGFLAAAKPLHSIYIKEPIWTKLLGDALITVHPLGGCVMAPSAELGVVDHKGRVFSGTTGTDVHPGLYVSDGSVIPMSLSVNPSLTISAITERCCALIAEDRGWKIDYSV